VVKGRSAFVVLPFRAVVFPVDINGGGFEEPPDLLHISNTHRFP